MTILPHLFTSLMSVSPYFITRNSTFSLSQYWFFLIFVTGGTNYIIFSHVWSFLDQFLTREAYFSYLITSVRYANHVSISTPACLSCYVNTHLCFALCQFLRMVSILVEFRIRYQRKLINQMKQEVSLIH